MPPEVSTAASPTVILQGWLPLIGIVVALLAPLGPAIFGVWLASHNAAKARQAAEVVAQQLAAVDGRTAAKLDTIHSLVNSRLSAALQKIDCLEQRLFETEGIPPTGEEPPSDEESPPPTYPTGPAT